MRLIKTYRQILQDYPKDNANLFKCISAKFLNPGFSVVYLYRLGCFYNQSKFKLLRVLGSRVRMKLVFKKNCDISFMSEIGDKLRLPHPFGVVIGTGVKIGKNVTIFQNVTLGSNGKQNQEKSYPVIGDNVTIYADSIIIGNIIIGENSVIGTKTLVNIDVPANAVVVGNPCRIVTKK